MTPRESVRRRGSGKIPEYQACDVSHAFRGAVATRLAQGDPYRIVLGFNDLPVMGGEVSDILDDLTEAADEDP